MLDLSSTILAKSDQLNAEDLAEPKTLKITEVKAIKGDQPVAIHYENENGRPYKPCKSMIKLMIYAWGKDAELWAGKSMTVYNDLSVKWAGKAVGGIRISHLSDILQNFKMSLTLTRGQKGEYHIEALKVEEPKPEAPIEEQREKMLKVIVDKDFEVSEEQMLKITEAKTRAELTAIYKDIAK